MVVQGRPELVALVAEIAGRQNLLPYGLMGVKKGVAGFPWIPCQSALTDLRLQAAGFFIGKQMEPFISNFKGVHYYKGRVNSLYF